MESFRDAVNREKIVAREAQRSQEAERAQELRTLQEEELIEARAKQLASAYLRDAVDHLYSHDVKKMGAYHIKPRVLSYSYTRHPYMVWRLTRYVLTDEKSPRLLHGYGPADDTGRTPRAVRGFVHVPIENKLRWGPLATTFNRPPFWGYDPEFNNVQLRDVQQSCRQWPAGDSSDGRDEPRIVLRAHVREDQWEGWTHHDARVSLRDWLASEIVAATTS